jgi:uncharacterized protein with ParB-like and HNH nuclease domain
MKAIDRQFTKIINGTTQFVIPVFQRDYSWTELQCAQLWKDVLSVGQGADEKAHFIGSVVYVPSGDTSAGFTRWLLIDGQQRVTTLTLMLIALREHLKESNYSPTSEDGPTAKRIEAYFLKNILEEGSREQKLVLRRRDQATLAALLNNEELPQDLSPRVYENYTFFREQLKAADPADVYRGIGRLIVVDVTLDRGSDDPQMIFESLNSTGIDLTQADLIRNYILMRLPEPEQTRLYKTYWQKIEDLFRDAGRRFDSFARDYMALKTQAGKQVRANEIYQAFRPFYKDRANALGHEELLNEMLRYARYYAAFTMGTWPKSRIRTRLQRVSRLAETSAVLVLRLFECHKERETLTDSDFCEALELIESYIFRRVICGAQTRGYWARFSGIAYRLPDEGALLRLKVELARQPAAYRFISNRDFRSELLARPIYGMRVCHLLLDRLENEGSKEPVDTSQYSIEHILPQNENLPKEWRFMLGQDWANLQGKWVHRLGNLTLTGYNSEYSDRSFIDKKTIPGGFSESSIRLNKWVREQEFWTVQQIEERSDFLADKALSIWRPLNVAANAISTVELEELRKSAMRRTANDVQMNPKTRELLNALREQVLGIGEVIEKGESKSVSYFADSGYAGEFFMEVLPRKGYLTLLMDIDFDEVSHVSSRVQDATEQKFFFYARHSGGAFIHISDENEIPDALLCVKRAYEAMRI